MVYVNIFRFQPKRRICLSKAGSQSRYQKQIEQYLKDSVAQTVILHTIEVL